MSATNDRTRHETREALIRWHAREAVGLLDDLPTTFRMFFWPTRERLGEEDFERRFAPYMEELQEASDQFNHLYALLLGDEPAEEVAK